MDYLFVGLGGALGAMCRYWVNSLSLGISSTLVVNIVGSFFAGAIVASLRNQFANSDLFLFLIVGLAGGFTTFSAFSADVFKLLVAHDWGRAGVFILANVFLSVFAFMAAYFAVARVFRIL